VPTGYDLPAYLASGIRRTEEPSKTVGGLGHQIASRYIDQMMLV